MPRNLKTRNGEPSFDGINPKLKRFGGLLFGWHKDYEPCIYCHNWTSYALHRRYKFTPRFESHMAKSDRLWCCSDDCFKRATLERMFDLAIPYEVSSKIVGV